jgi:DHA1 family tetracycline resistance protein-like MFS transporter
MSLFGVAGMIAPLIFTQLFRLAISPARAVQLPGAPYWLAAALMAGCFFLAWIATRREETTIPAVEVAK